MRPRPFFALHEPGSHFIHDSVSDRTGVAQSRIIRANEVSAHQALETAKRLGVR